MSAYVTFPCIFVQEAFRTKLALPRSLAGMPFYMELKLRRCGKLPAAEIATVWFFTGVNTHMFLQIAILRKALLAYRTSIWLLTIVPSKIERYNF